MARNSQRKEGDEVYNPIAENSLFSVMNDLYDKDIERYKSIVNEDSMEFNKLVWDNDKSSNTNTY